MIAPDGPIQADQRCALWLSTASFDIGHISPEPGATRYGVRLDAGGVLPYDDRALGHATGFVHDEAQAAIFKEERDDDGPSFG